MNAAGDLMPSLRNVMLASKLNGIFSFTPTTASPCWASPPSCRASGRPRPVWITHAGGVGQAVAQWISSGDPGVDLHECDIRRFHAHALSRPYVRARAAPAVPRSLRHHPPPPADDPPPQPAPFALPSTPAGAGRGPSSKMPAGSGPSGTKRISLYSTT